MPQYCTCKARLSWIDEEDTWLDRVSTFYENEGAYLLEYLDDLEIEPLEAPEIVT
jgi:hypothetical protein